MASSRACVISRAFFPAAETLRAAFSARESLAGAGLVVRKSWRSALTWDGGWGWWEDGHWSPNLAWEMCQELNHMFDPLVKTMFVSLLDCRAGVNCWLWSWGPIFSNLGLGWATYRYHCQRLGGLPLTSGRPIWTNKLWKLATLRKVLLLCYLVWNLILLFKWLL